MPKPCSAVACPALLKRLAGAAIFLLLTSAWGWAQESVSGTSATSVDGAFLTFHQALSATANDLLARKEKQDRTFNCRRQSNEYKRYSRCWNRF